MPFAHRAVRQLSECASALTLSAGALPEAHPIHDEAIFHVGVTR